MVDERPDKPRDALTSKIKFDVPHSARIWNYWMGGKDNYEVDRAAGDAGVEVYPDIVTMAKQSRRFLVRAVRYLAGEAGIRQFLDVGTGLPTMQNTHEVAQQIAPECRIVYVDNDPLVLAHARALLVNTTPEGVTTYIDADFHDPDLIISDARNVLNFTQPIGVMFMGVLGHVAESDDMRSIVARVMAAVPSGSYLVLWDGTDTNKTYVELCQNYARTGGVPYIPRGIEQIGRCFEGLEMVDPSLVSITQWRPDTAEVGEGEPMDAAVPWPASRESPPRTTWTSSRHRLAACADVPAVCLGPTPALTARSRSPSTRVFTDPSSRWPGIGYPGAATVMGAHNWLCAHSQLRLVVSADNWQVSKMSWSGRRNGHGSAVRHQNGSSAGPI